MNIDAVRAEFPAIGREAGGRSIVFFDKPAGTWVSRRVLRRMEEAMTALDANPGGVFRAPIGAGTTVGEASPAVPPAGPEETPEARIVRRIRPLQAQGQRIRWTMRERSSRSREDAAPRQARGNGTWNDDEGGTPGCVSETARQLRSSIMDGNEG